MTVERDAGTHSIRGCVEGWEDWLHEGQSLKA
jgi:hypothetical protein